MKDVQHLIDMYANPRKLAELVSAELQCATADVYNPNPLDIDLAALELRVLAGPRLES